MAKTKHISRSTWEEFVDSGLLWFINRTLHLFGWAIVVEADEQSKITEVYPARCKFRGFSEEIEEEGFVNLTRHLKKNISSLCEVVDKIIP